MHSITSDKLPDCPTALEEPVFKPHPVYPKNLMTTEAVASILGDPTYRIIEVDMDPEAYAEGHLEGAILWDWENQLRDTETHEILSPVQFGALLGASGITPLHRIVIYGDNNNWFACWAYWLLNMIGHKNVWLMDGGSRKWFSEGRAVTTEVLPSQPTTYPLKPYDLTEKATTDHIFEAFFSPKSHRLIDVRSSAEFEGKLRGPAGLEARCATAGRIPTSINIPWNLNCNSDGTFKTSADLRSLYESFDVLPGNSVITYCAIGERASLSWFVLRMLLGYEVVMNYDRSMAEWSRLANAPMITAEAA